MKKHELRLNRFAQDDIEKTIEYYNEKKEGLGDELWQETKAKLEDIEKNPQMAPVCNAASIVQGFSGSGVLDLKY